MTTITLLPCYSYLSSNTIFDKIPTCEIFWRQLSQIHMSIFFLYFSFVAFQCVTMINSSVHYINKKITLPLFLFFFFLSPFSSFSFSSPLPHFSIFFPRHHFPPPGHSILHNIYPRVKSDMVMFLGLFAGHSNFASSCLLAKSRLGWSGGLQYWK